MRKLFYMSVAAMLLSLSACESEPKNPGDFSVKSELTMAELVSLKTGAVYPLQVKINRDTTYIYEVIRDKKKYNPDSTYVVVKDTSYHAGNSGKYIEFEKVMLPSYPELPYDTLELKITSNARWLANEPEVAWFSNVGKVVVGGGNGRILMSIKQFGNEVSKNVAEQTIMTSDSTLLYMLPIGHTGLKYKPQ